MPLSSSAATRCASSGETLRRDDTRTARACRSVLRHAPGALARRSRRARRRPARDRRRGSLDLASGSAKTCRRRRCRRARGRCGRGSRRACAGDVDRAHAAGARRAPCRSSCCDDLQVHQPRLDRRRSTARSTAATTISRELHGRAPVADGRRLARRLRRDVARAVATDSRIALPACRPPSVLLRRPSATARRRWTCRAARRRHPLDDDGLVRASGARASAARSRCCSIRFGARSVSISSRRWRLTSSSAARSCCICSHAVAVPQQLEVLPGREQQHRHEHDADPGRAPQLPLPRLVDLADDRVVADVLLDRVFEVDRRSCQPLDRAQLRAARARVALRLPRRRHRSAASSAMRDRAVAAAPARGTCASRCGPRASETRSPPAARRPSSRRDGVVEERVEAVELAVHPDAQRLERARRRVDALLAAPRNARGARSRPAAPVVSIGARSRAVDDGARDAPRVALLAELEDHVRPAPSSSTSRQQIGRGRPAATVHAHVERLVAAEAEAAPVGVELHRRHAEIGERAGDRVDAARVEHRGEIAIVRVHELDAIAERRERSRARSRRASRVAIEPDARASRRASSSARLCPPRPTVQSTNRPPRSGCSSASASATQHRLVQRRHAVRSRTPQRARVVVGERLALQLRDEPLVVPDVEVVELAEHVDFARHRRRVAQPRRESPRGPARRSRAVWP